MDGGPSHYETFDPKPGAPKEIRGEFSPIATSVPGVFFSEPMKRLASIADKLAIVRSICHNQGNHGAGNHYMMTGAPTRIPVGCGAFVSFHPSLGSVTAYERGTTGGMPPYFSIPSMSRSGGPNFLGAKYAPFVVPDNPNRNGLPGPRRRAAPRTGGTAVRSTTRPSCPGRPLPSLYRRGRGRPGRDARHVLRAGLRPDVLAGCPAGLQHRQRARHGPRRLWSEHLRPARAAGPTPGRGRRAFHHPE